MGLLFQKVHSRVGAGGVLTNYPRAKKKAPNSTLSKNVAAKWAPGGPWGDLGGPFGVPWGPLGCPGGNKKKSCPAVFRQTLGKGAYGSFSRTVDLPSD